MESEQAGEGFSVPSVRLGPKLQVDVDRVLIGLTAWRLDLQARPAFVREWELPIHGPEVSARHRVSNCLLVRGRRETEEMTHRAISVVANSGSMEV